MTLIPSHLSDVWFPQMSRRRLASRSCWRDPSSRGIMWHWSVMPTATLSPTPSTFTSRSVGHRLGLAAVALLIWNSASVPPVRHGGSHLLLRTFKVPIWNCHEGGGGLVPFDFNLFSLAVLFKSLIPVIISPLIWVLLCYKSNKVDVHIAFPLHAVPPLSIIWLKWQNLIVSFLPALRHQGQKVLVEDMDTYTLNSISREESGEYKCSLADNEKMEASQNIAVSCEYLWHMQQPARKSLLRHGKFTFLFPSRILKTAAIHEEAPLFTPKMSR